MNARDRRNAARKAKFGRKPNGWHGRTNTNAKGYISAFTRESMVSDSVGSRHTLTEKDQ